MSLETAAGTDCAHCPAVSAANKDHNMPINVNNNRHHFTAIIHTLATAPPVKNWRRFGWCKVLLPLCPCWWQPVHSDQGGDAGVLLNSVIYTVSVPYAHQLQIIFLHFRSKESCIRWAAHCGATWQIQLHDPCEAAMQPYFDHVLIIHWTGFLL